jgi:hypothetical protein
MLSIFDATGCTFRRPRAPVWLGQSAFGCWTELRRFASKLQLEGNLCPLSVSASACQLDDPNFASNVATAAKRALTRLGLRPLPGPIPRRHGSVLLGQRVATRVSTGRKRAAAAVCGHGAEGVR